MSRPGCRPRFWHFRVNPSGRAGRRRWKRPFRPVSCGLELAAPDERPTQGYLVGVLEIAADGQPAGEARDTGAVTEAVGEVRRRRLAVHIRVRREHDFLDAVPLDALQQLVDSKVLRL